MKTSLTSVTFRKKSIQEIVELAQRAGLQAIEWGSDVHVPATDPAAAELALRLTREHGMTVSAYGSYYRCGSDEDFAPYVDSALRLETGIIRVWAGRLGSAVCPPETRAELTENLKKAVALAAEKGITVATEYHPNTLTDDPISVLKLLDDVPGLYTYWQPPTSIPNPVERNNWILQALGKRCIYVHVYHRNDANQKVPLSEGAENWKQYFRAAQQYCAVQYGAIEFVMDDTDEQLLDDAAAFQAILSQV